MTDISAPKDTTNIKWAMRKQMMKDFWFYFSENRGAVLGLWVFIGLVILAIFAPIIAPHDPTQQYRDHFLQPPVWQQGGDWNFILGTDAVGRDMLSRIIHGARYSLLIGSLVVLFSLVTGVATGLFSGYMGGPIDTFITRSMDIIMAFPTLLLALVLVAILGPGLINAIIAISIVLQPHFVRLTRAAVISEINKDYVTSARVSGAGSLYLMFRTLLPNCVGPVMVQATLSFSSAILDASALGFLGMGAQPPIPEWGTMLADSREFIERAWWAVTFPGLAILITVVAINLMGDGLRDALDPKMKRS